MVSSPLSKAVLEKSLSFRNWEAQVAELDDDKQASSNNEVESHPSRIKTPANFVVPRVKLPQPPSSFTSPRIFSELDDAATTLQRVYKGYRTRRNLADCAVVVEELWWKALDFASLKRTSVSFFHEEKQETAVSKWSRAKNRLARVGKGLSKDEKAQKLALQHWLEAIDPRHRYGHNLHLYYDVWFACESAQPFFYWLDVGDGREVNLEKCPRSKLQKQLITYLGPKEREAYEVIADKGKLLYKQSQELLNTTEGSKWIFVLSTSRTLYVGRKNKGTFQHSSFLAGGATTAAGRMVAKEGKLKAIWPYSGHYLPTEYHFKEFISFLEDNHVDLTDVKRCAVDDDEYPTPEKNGVEIAEAVTEVVNDRNEVENKEAEQPSEQNKEEVAFDIGKPLSCKWSTGTGARISCVCDYSADLRSKALEQVNLSPRVVPSPIWNKVPIPSPRPSNKVRLSPRFQYMGIPTPTGVSPAIALMN
ncbi:IQ domain-containing protein IQM4-like [Curcuma longa]|uniref:IQ domain-containing protein IQM4-like n=1 Tax=Curcuma longa TaxID=136217 RepID=UPI003D9F1C11